jgi:hypothetical protein
MDRYDAWLEQPYQDHYRQQEEAEEQMWMTIDYKHADYIAELNKLDECDAWAKLEADIDSILLMGKIAKLYAAHHQDSAALGAAVKQAIDDAILDVIYYEVSGGEQRNGKL